MIKSGPLFFWVQSNCGGTVWVPVEVTPVEILIINIGITYLEVIDYIIRSDHL